MGLTRVLGHIWAVIKKHMPEPLGSMGNDMGIHEQCTEPLAGVKPVMHINCYFPNPGHAK